MACKLYKLHKLHQRYILKGGGFYIVMWWDFVRVLVSSIRNLQSQMPYFSSSCPYLSLFIVSSFKSPRWYNSHRRIHPDMSYVADRALQTNDNHCGNIKCYWIEWIWTDTRANGLSVRFKLNNLLSLFSLCGTLTLFGDFKELHGVVFPLFLAC